MELDSAKAWEALGNAVRPGIAGSGAEPLCNHKQPRYPTVIVVTLMVRQGPLERFASHETRRPAS